MSGTNWARRAGRMQVALLFLGIAIPLGLFSWTAWREKEQALAEAERTAVRTVVALHQHTLRILELQELVLDEIESSISGRSWDVIEADGTLRWRLARITEKMDQISAINLVDASGRVRLTTTNASPPDRNMADRDYFQAQRELDAGTYVSAAYTSRISGDRLIGLSRRRSAADGSFDGIIHVAVPIAYFTSFWEQFAPTIAHVVPLVRSDGQVIARHPAPKTPERLDPNGPFLSRALKQPTGTYTAVSQVDGIERLNAYQQIRGYPLFVSFSIETRAILEQWRRDLLKYAIFSALAAVALMTGVVMAVQRYWVQEEASRRWQATADELAAEMARRETAEATLRQSQKMECIGQLTGGVAHDFNNLLMAIQGSLDLLLRRLPGDQGPARQLLDNALKAVDRGAALTHRMLAFARKQELKPEPVSVPTLVGGIIDLLARSLGSQIAIQTRFAQQLPHALVDGNQLELAILNLAVNARDAMPLGGTLTIDVSHQADEDGRACAPRGFVQVSLTDTGVGMDEETLARATEPFFTTKEVGKGTGLGLSMVYGLAHQSGGQFRLASRKGEGTKAELLLPVAPEHDSAALAVERRQGNPRQPCQSGLVVLAVDDDELVLMSTAAMLEELGHLTLEATSGREALQVLRTGRRVDVVITDQMMPGMTGLQLAAAIKAERPDLPVVVATGYADLPPEADTLVVGRLGKPYRQNDVAAMLARAIAKTSGDNVIPLRRGA